MSVFAVLFLVFAIFGTTKDFNGYETAVPEIKRVSSGAAKNQALTFSEELSKSEGLGYGKDAVITRFSHSIPADEAPSSDRKIIKEGSAYIETTDFERSMAAIDDMIAQYGGFAEKKELRGSSLNANDLRNATIVFRVPSQNFETVMNQMGNVGVVVQSSTSGTDITDEYIDYETRIRNLKVQEETLLDILSKAEKLEDVITLESRISEVRYEIETIENRLKNYDRLVQYSRITVELSEVVETTRATPVARTLGARMNTAFRSSIDSFVDGLENFAVWLAYNWILLTVVFLLVVMAIAFIKARKRRRKNRITASANAESAESSSNEQENG